jgi:hypothetical protein
MTLKKLNGAAFGPFSLSVVTNAIGLGTTEPVRSEYCCEAEMVAGSTDFIFI